MLEYLNSLILILLKRVIDPENLSNEVKDYIYSKKF